MNRIVIVIFAFLASFINAQYTEIKYIPSIATDTLTAKAQLYNNLFSKGKFNPLIFEQGIKVGERRQSITLRDKDIFYIEFLDKKMNKRVFQQVLELKQPGKLFEVLAKGKISWYRRYFSYKADALDSNSAHEDFFIKNGEITKVPVKGKYKKKLQHLVQENPELVQEAKKIVNDQDIMDIILKYNKL